MARSNPTWGEERIAADLLLKLGSRVSLRTGRRDMPNGARGRDGPSSQRWRIVVRPHTKAMDQGQAWLLGSLGREEDFCSLDAMKALRLLSTAAYAAGDPGEMRGGPRSEAVHRQGVHRR